jgi:hypothetical protein
MTFHDTVDELDHIRHSSQMSSEFFVEGVQYQSVRPVKAALPSEACF